jgi:hypothetical protein
MGAKCGSSDIPGGTRNAGVAGLPVGARVSSGRRMPLFGHDNRVVLLNFVAEGP